jgi:DNA repair protein RadC
MKARDRREERAPRAPRAPRNMEAMTDQQVLDKAARIIQRRYLNDNPVFCSVSKVMDFLSCKLALKEHEVFAIMYLDSQHRLIEYREMFIGTIDSASVYPREIVKAALQVNAAAVILTHNHPSGDATPSECDKRITNKLIGALNLVDIRTLDHIIVGEKPVSFANLGLI